MKTRRLKKIVIEDEDEEEINNNNINNTNNNNMISPNNNNHDNNSKNMKSKEYIEYYKLKERIESLAKIKNINLTTYKPPAQIKTIQDFKIKYKLNSSVNNKISKNVIIDNNNNNNDSINNDNSTNNKLDKEYSDIAYKTPINNKLVKKEENDSESDSGQEEEVYKTPIGKGKRLSSHLKTLKRLSVNGQVLDYLSNETLSGQQIVNNSVSSQKSTTLEKDTLQSILENDDEDVELVILNSSLKNNKDNGKSVEQLLLDKSPSDSKPIITPVAATVSINQTPKKKKDDKEDKDKEDKVLELLSKTTITPKSEKQQESVNLLNENTKIKQSPPLSTKQNSNDSPITTIIATKTTSTTSTTSTNTTASNITVPTTLNKNDSNMKKLIKEFRLTSLGENNKNEDNSSNNNSINNNNNSNSNNNTFVDFNKTKSFYPIEPNNDKYNESMLCSPLNLETAHLPGVKEFFERDKKIHAISYFKRYNRTVFQNKFPEDMIIWSDEHLATPGKTTITKKNDINFAKITLSSKLVNSIETLANVLCHEMCHAATWMFDNSKKAHGSEFKFWVRIAQSQYPELSIDMCDNFKSTFPYHYKCQNKTCDVSFGRATQLEDLLYCGKCKSPIVPVEKVETESRFDKFFKDHLEETQKKHPNLSLDEIKSIIQLKWRNYQVEQEKLKKKEKLLLNQNDSNNTSPTKTSTSATSLSSTTKPAPSAKSSKSKLISIPIEDLPQIPTSSKINSKTINK